MAPDPRIRGIQLLISKRKIKNLSEIFTIGKYPRTEVARYFGMNNNRMARVIHFPADLCYWDIEAFAQYFGVEYTDMERLVIKQFFYTHPKNQNRPTRIFYEK